MTIKHICADCGAKFHHTESFMQHDCDTCPHTSWTGVDTTPLEDPTKVWECDGCGIQRTEHDIDTREGLTS